MSHPLRIALVSPYDFAVPGGVNRHVAALAHYLQARGHAPTILAPSSEPPADASPLHPISTVTIPVPFSGSVARLSLSPVAVLRVRRLLEETPFDIIHIHEPTIPTLAPIVVRYAKSVLVGTFHAYREENLAFDFGKPLFRYLDALHGRIAVSEAARDYIAAYFPAEYRIIPNGIEWAMFADPAIHPFETYQQQGPVILFVGRLEERKGFRHLLRAFRQVKTQVPNAQLVVVGAFQREEITPYVQYIRHYRVHGVRFVGYVPTEELPRWYRTATIFCAPSVGFESFGIVLLEAMAAGVPVVASDISGYRCVVQHGVQGELVPPGDEEALAETLVRLLHDPATCERYGAAGRETSRRYDWRVVAEEVESFYTELLTAHCLSSS